MRYGSNILVVEDNPGDQFLLTDTLKNGVTGARIHIVEDGEKATQFLHRQGSYSEAPRPDLIILDLNLPKKDGREVLKEIKASPTLKCIPVVILTSSDADKDIIAAYDGHANSYFCKPPDLEEFLQVLSEIKKYWLSLVKLPAHC